MDKKDVVIYSTPTCGFCNIAKEYFKEKGVEYTGYDVSMDESKRDEMIEKSGQTGVPVIVIGGEMTVGFDKKKIDEMLELK